MKVSVWPEKRKNFLKNKNMEDKDKIIQLQRKKIEELSRKINAQEQELFLLNEEIKLLKKGAKRLIL